MDFFSIISLIGLSRIIEQTQNHLFLCLPGIPSLTSQSILRLKKQKPNVEINLLIDFDPQTFRQGYGEFDAFSELQKCGIEVNNFPDNRISFVISDNNGYYLFFESQYLVPAEKETLNAIRIDNVSLVKLKQHFFSKSSVKNFTNDLSNAIIEESKQLIRLETEKELPEPAKVTSITKAQSEELKREIDMKPPLKPDHKRIIDTYSNKFQYVDLRFYGAKVTNKEVAIPKNLLPIKNKQLREQFHTKVKIFEEALKFKELTELKGLEDELNKIRKDFLFHSKVCNKSILNIEKSSEFEKKVKELQAKIPKISQDLLDFLHTEQDKTKDRFYNEIKETVLQDPSIVIEENPTWQHNQQTIAILAKKKANTVLTKIKWPDYFKILEKMSISLFFSDITINDLYNQELLDEFKENGIISEADAKQLSTFNKSVPVSPEKPNTYQTTLFQTS